MSAASAWEIATKYRLGELDGAEAIVTGMIAAQCMTRAIPLVTADAALTAFPAVSTVW